MICETLRGFEAVSFDGRTMGTTYGVRLALARRDAALVAAARAAVHAALDAVDTRMSTFKADSELSTFNRRGAERPLVVGDDTLAVLLAAQDVSRATGGAFDVTVGGCVDAWGFGPGGDKGIVDAHRLASLRRAVGHDGLVLDAREHSVAKTHPHLRADLSAIAKGFGVDQAARALDALGVQDYLVEVGGELRARGLRPDGRPWRVGIEHPVRAATRQVRYAVPLHERSMATSGDYRHCFEHAGRRYSHEIDPRTGRPISSRVASVTVVARDCMQADAFSTALIVLGADDGMACALRLDLAAHFVLREPGGGFAERTTPAFVALGGSPLRLA